jgi:hypothetical protein
MDPGFIVACIWLAILTILMVGVYIRVGNMLTDLRRLNRTGVLIEDINSTRMKPVRLASPRQKQRYIERVLNQEK